MNTGAYGQLLCDICDETAVSVTFPSSGDWPTLLSLTRARCSRHTTASTPNTYFLQGSASTPHVDQYDAIPTRRPAQ